MEEGNLRVDVNISIRPEGQKELGTRTEIKNMNSFASVAAAIRHEVDRQTELVERGGVVVQETLLYDPDHDTVSAMRSKEEAHDYRYFPEPDLPPIEVGDAYVEELRQALPELPDAKLRRYIEDMDIPPKDAALLVRYPAIGSYFERASDGLEKPKTVSNFMIGQIFRRLEGDDGKEKADIAIPPDYLGELAGMLESGQISMNIAKNALERMLDAGARAADVLAPEDLAGFDASSLDDIIRKVLDAQPGAVKDYLAGKEKALKSLVGGVMKETRGKADAPAAEAALIRALEQMR
jgi:aspartyl-tRNA(Asn)/glutamyl-tRNA(Gln) amidotransferase subunit B